MNKSTRRLLLLTSQATGAAILSYFAYSCLTNEDKRKIKQFGEASYRIYNFVTTAAVIAADYKYTMFLNQEDSVEADLNAHRKELKRLQRIEEELSLQRMASTEPATCRQLENQIFTNKQSMQDISVKIVALKDGPRRSYLAPTHTRSALRLKKMCIANKGVYIKLGQHISMLDYMVPIEYQTVLSSLLANNPVSSWESIATTIQEDLKLPPEQIWARIDHTPIASASLAQVHVAYDDRGNKYAVKIQHDNLSYGCKGDMRAITFFVHLLSKIFKDFNYNWLTGEMNKNLPLELNFLNEARNIEICTNNFKSEIADGTVVVPKVYEDLSSRRILTMSFEEGCFVTDVEKLDEMKLNKRDVAKLVAQTYCSQIHLHGFVNCDPHEANMLVRPDPRRPHQPQLVLLDHGLCRRLEPDFKYNYTRLWNAIFKADEGGIKYYSQKLNAGDSYPLLAAMMTLKSWDNVIAREKRAGTADRLKSVKTSAEKELLAMYVVKYFKDIVKMLGVLPSDFLLMMKTTDCLRHIDRKLGAPINTMLVTAETISEVLVNEEIAQIWHNYTGFEAAVLAIPVYLSWWNMYVRIFAMRLMAKIIYIQQYVYDFFSYMIN